MLQVAAEFRSRALLFFPRVVFLMCYLFHDLLNNKLKVAETCISEFAGLAFNKFSSLGSKSGILIWIVLFWTCWIKLFTHAWQECACWLWRTENALFLIAGERWPGRCDLLGNWGARKTNYSSLGQDICKVSETAGWCPWSLSRFWLEDFTESTSRGWGEDRREIRGEKIGIFFLFLGPFLPLASGASPSEPML